jgi:PAS domain-containing protein
MEGGAVAVFAAGERALLTARCELLERVLHALNDAITVRDRFGAIVFQNRAAHLPSARVLNTDFITTLATPLPPLPSSGCATEATGLGASPSDGSAIEVRSSMSWENPLVRRILDGVPQNAWQNPASTGAVDFHNKWWFNYTGLQPGASCGWGWKQVVHPDDVERASATWMASFEAGEICLAELRIRGADGIYRWFLSCGTPLLNDAGVVARWMGTAIDISAQKALQDALEDERALLNTALDQLPVGVIIAEASAGSFRFINKKMHELSQAA